MAPKLESLYTKYQILGFNVLVKIGLQQILSCQPKDILLLETRQEISSNILA